MSNINNAETTKMRSIQTTAGFTVYDRKIEAVHSFQCYANYGSTEKGPWVVIGLNETEYGIGYLPETVVKPKTQAPPKLEPVPNN